MRKILIYKRTHEGDPDDNGCFGARDCMGEVRDWDFDAVIGVGGLGTEARANGIAGKINWIGISPRRTPVPDKRGSEVTFDHFRDFGADGQDFRSLAPALAERMYARNVRRVMDGLTDQEYSEAIKILELAEDAPPSPGRKANRGRRSRLCRSVASRLLSRCN